MHTRDEEKNDMAKIADALAEAKSAATAVIRGITKVEVAETTGDLEKETAARDALDMSRTKWKLLRLEVSQALNKGAAETKSQNGALFDKPASGIESVTISTPGSEPVTLTKDAAKKIGDAVKAGR